MIEYQFTIIYKLKHNINTESLFILPCDAYEQIDSLIKYNVMINDDKIKIKELDNTKYIINGFKVDVNNMYVEKGLDMTNKKIECVYLLSMYAGGRFVIYNDNWCEFSEYGLGVHVVSSELGSFEIFESNH